MTGAATGGKLVGSVAVVTAAGQGLGEAIAKTLAREGAAVVVSDINETEAERVKDAIVAAGGTAVVILADVTKSPAVAHLFESAVARFGPVDILVNVAGGFSRYVAITEIEEEEWDRVVTLNLKTCFLCSQAAARIMIANKKGRIINIASQGGVGPNPYARSFIPYGASKAGVIALAKHMAKDLGVHGITVNAISPSTALTPRVMKVRDEAARAQIASQNAMKKLIEPQDCAEAVLFLASPEARYITGINLNVNAGTLIA
jgi:NAD(P)-dependent dehydrogenase (short-subunit alcohol dehydrogenase family)